MAPIATENVHRRVTSPGKRRKRRKTPGRRGNAKRVTSPKQIVKELRAAQKAKQERREKYVTQDEFKMYFQRMLTEVHSAFEQQDERLTQVEMLTVTMYNRIESLSKKVAELQTKNKLQQEEGNSDETTSSKEPGEEVNGEVLLASNGYQTTPQKEHNNTTTSPPVVGGALLNTENVTPLKESKSNDNLTIMSTTTTTTTTTTAETTPEHDNGLSPDPPMPVLSPFSFAPKDLKLETVTAIMDATLTEVQSNLSTPRTPRESDRYTAMVDELKREMASPLGSPAIAETSAENEFIAALKKQEAASQPDNNKEEKPQEQQPVEQAPVEQPPVDKAPVEQQPEEKAPVETTPAKTSPVKTTPVKTAPVKTAPVKTTPPENTEENDIPETEWPEKDNTMVNPSPADEVLNELASLDATASPEQQRHTRDEPEESNNTVEAATTPTKDATETPNEGTNPPPESPPANVEAQNKPEEFPVHHSNQVEPYTTAKPTSPKGVSITTTPYRDVTPPRAFNTLPIASGVESSPFDLDSVIDTATVLSEDSSDEITEVGGGKPPVMEVEEPHAVEEEEDGEEEDVSESSVIYNGEDVSESSVIFNGEDASESSVVFNGEDTSEGSVFMVSDGETEPPGSVPHGASLDETDNTPQLSEAEKQRDVLRQRLFSSNVESIEPTPYDRYVYEDDVDASLDNDLSRSKGRILKQTLMICPALSRMVTSVLLTFANLPPLTSLNVAQTYRNMTITAVIHSGVYFMDVATALESFGTGKDNNRWLDWMLFNLCSRQFTFSYKDSTGASYSIMWDDFLNPQVSNEVAGSDSTPGAPWCEYQFHFIPHFLTLFGLPSLTEVHRTMTHAILVEVAATTDKNTQISYNGTPLPAQSLEAYAQHYFGPESFQVLRVSDKFHVVITSSDEADPMPISFVNAHLTINGGKHVRYVKKCLNRAALTKESRRKLKSSMGSKYNVLNHFRIFVSVHLDDPILSSDGTALKELKTRHVGRISDGDALLILKGLGIDAPLSIDDFDF